MSKYKIEGARPVADRAPGETISETDLADANIDALVEAGHLVPVASATSKKTADPNIEEK